MTFPESMKSIPELLDKRDSIYLEWYEPCSGENKFGGDVIVDVTLRATVAGCIAKERFDQCGKGKKSSDADLLLDFMAVYMAQVVDEK